MFLPKTEIIDTDKVQIEVPDNDLMRSDSNAPGGGENPFGDPPPAAPDAAPAAAPAGSDAKQ